MFCRLNDYKQSISIEWDSLSLALPKKTIGSVYHISGLFSALTPYSNAFSGYPPVIGLNFLDNYNGSLGVFPENISEQIRDSFD
jgi:hypothetical protein